MEPVDSQLGFGRAFICAISENPQLVASIANRFPVQIVDGTAPYCMVCQDEGTVNSFAIYERLQCQGAGCKYDAARPNSKPAETWLCESCAVRIDIDKQGGDESGSDDVRRNFVCRCATYSPCIAETYMVTRLPGGAEQVFKCSRDAQVALVLNGRDYFNKMPSVQQLRENPACWREHARTCMREENALRQPDIDASKKRSMDEAAFGAAGWPQQDGDGRWEASYTYKKLSVESCFNVDYARGESCVSVQFVKVGSGIRVVAGTPKSTVRMFDTSDLSRAATKGVSQRKSCGGQGVSSDGCAREMSDKNGEGTVSYLFSLDGEGPIEIEVDSVLPKGDMISFLKNLGDEAQFQAVPTFIPIPTMNLIETNVDTSETIKIKQLRDICDFHGCKYDETGPKFALIDVDVGVERLFQSINRSLAITGFGSNAAWQWQVVMFRQGSVYMTLYVLVAQVPFPGLWVIAQKTDSAHGCSSVKMVGEDMAPWGRYTDRVHKKTVERGLWTEYGMDRFYLGYTKNSATLLKCLNSDPERFGPLITALLVADFIGVEDIKRALVVQAAKATALFAENLRDMGCSFIEANLGAPARKRGIDVKNAIDKSRVDLGKYGSIVVNMQVGDDPLSLIVPEINLSGPVLTFTLQEDPDEYMNILVSHEDNVHDATSIEPFKFKFCIIGATGDEDEIHNGKWDREQWDFSTEVDGAICGKHIRYVLKHDNGPVILELVTTCPNRV